MNFGGFIKRRAESTLIQKDTRRPVKKLESLIFLPNGLFKQRNTVYFIPSKIKRIDYKVNIFRDMIFSLKNEWKNEYKPLLSKIKTPSEVYENARIAGICVTSCSDDFDEIELDARMDSFRREASYNKIINELYCMFIQKVTAEIDRFTLLFMVDCGYKRTDFSFDNFAKFTEKYVGKDRSRDLFRSLKGYNCYSLLHRINNFLKHNSKDAYNSLLYTYPANVRSVKMGTAKEEYQNGMFAGDWIILKTNYLDEIFDKLIGFFEDYCNKVLHEDLEESKWNYDEYFENAFYEMKNPKKFFGV